jgi:hypothetical protein
MLRLMANTAMLAKPIQWDPKGRYLPTTAINEHSKLTLLVSSFIFPSTSDLTTSPTSTSPTSTRPDTSPPAPPPTPQPSTIPIPLDDDNDNDNEFMPETTSPFWGDDEHETENPQDFLKSMQHWGLNKSNATNAQKLENFELNLKSGAAAEQWWDSLSPGDKDIWDHLMLAFKRRWPSKTPTVKTIKEKQAALEQARISEEEVRKRITMNSMEELAHVVWADKIERLTASIPDVNSLLISTVHKSMPKVLQKVTGSGHTTWATFCRPYEQLHSPRSLRQRRKRRKHEFYGSR